MIQSMTGFGKSIVELPGKKITIELKSLNSKNLDLNARMPSQYRERELDLRGKIAKSLSRGKVDFSLYVEITGEATTASVNAEVVKKYIQQLKEIPPTGSADEASLLEIAMRLPDTLKTEREEIDESEFNAIDQGLEEALAEINDFRDAEGKALEKDFVLRIETLQQLLQEVIEIDPQRIDAVKERLQKGIEELKENVDENRFEQELVYYIEKYDITEEKTRLENHLSYFTETLNSSDSNGKKLGFIGQEIGREINTIGSKSNFAPMQKLVVQMKDELEKIKEQLLNVL
ncbi:YicC/YloC family endoribonuclease [Mesonia sp.]|uniref:YicC/YloC family endoribonuclease n=1 Tax=Mesonia sp. TaxID=1960830 RepID=UPI00176D731A|nr:YicC/YloC family endoribonuclease [Mesonia sp.]HIB36426.1 YicC family protein [Mesonia sp.]HIO26938.1 YicC family protein [Flavobacteriaceae bacterium]